MNCKECNIEFTQTRPNIDAQKYCSIKCRNLAAQKRRYEKIVSEANKKEIIISNNNRDIMSGNREIEYSRNENKSREYNNDIEQRVNPDFNARIELIETNFNTKSDLILCRLQLDYANKEIEELKHKIKELEVEIFDLENEENESLTKNEAFNHLIKGFSTDPVGVLNFAKQMFQSKSEINVN